MTHPQMSDANGVSLKTSLQCSVTDVDQSLRITVTLSPGAANEDSPIAPLSAGTVASHVLPSAERPREEAHHRVR